MSCGNTQGTSDATGPRPDGPIGTFNIDATGSLQNPAWSPDGKSLLITRFREGYNVEPADLLIVDIATGNTRTLVSDGSANVNLPGSVWHAATNTIVFSSSRGDHDEIYRIASDASPGDEVQVTSRNDLQSYEPSISQDGLWVVFESHRIDVEGNGVITRYKLDGSGGYQDLTAASDDCRQPNWSPDGTKITYQRLAGNQWDIWVMDVDGSNQRQITSGSGNKTDVSFSADSAALIYSADNDTIEFSNLFRSALSDSSTTRITDHVRYDGAPSQSPDGSRIAYESYDGDPDSSPGTDIWLTE